MADEADSAYHKTYYRENRAAILAKRAKRYREDPEYREARKEAARQQKKARREDAKKKPPKSRKGQPLKPKEHLVNVGGRDVKVLMFSAGQLGVALGRKTQTIRIWEKKGILPEALYRDGRGMRLYTELQVKELRKAYSRVKRSSPTFARTRIASTEFPQLAAEIWSQWPLGIDI